MTAEEWDLPAVDDPELSWKADALCAQTNPEAFFPEKGGSTRDAKRICASCEVRAQCLEYSLANDEKFGIWGGLSELDRRRLRKGTYRPPKAAPPKSVRTVPEHGTDLMWRRGCRTVGECPRADGLTCVQAHREYRAAAAAARRAKRDAA